MATTKELRLNEAQKRAIEHEGGPLLIIAGAGTGKTTVITERVKHLIATEKASPQEIAALTFTEKAAREMEERVDQAMPYGYVQMWISTFHSFADRVLRSEALHIGLDPAFKLMTQAESVQLMREHLYDFDLEYFRPAGAPTKFLSGMLQHFARLQDEDISPSDYTAWLKSVALNAKSEAEMLEVKKWQELANAYQTYDDIKTKKGFFDFGDLMVKLLYLLRERPNVLERYRKQFKYILIDEFQDTNIAQYELIKMLAPPAPDTRLTVVGDDSQCLPGDARIATLEGEKKIEEVRVGDMVITAVGKGHTSSNRVTKVFKNNKQARLLEFTLEDGKKVTVTDNHKMFCFLPSYYPFKDRYYVYLMHHQGFGWRIGMTNNVPARLRLETHADQIIAIQSYASEQEARFYEAYYSAKYGLPTVPFTVRPKQMISGNWLVKLFKDIDTRANAQRLAHDLRLELDSPQHQLGGVTRGLTNRVKINLHMCYRNYRSKTHRKGFLGSPAILHLVHLETSNTEIINKLTAGGFSLKKAKVGKRLRYATSDLSEALEVAMKLRDITGGFIDKKFNLGLYNKQHLYARIVPASHVLVGMYLPVLEGTEIVYKRVIDRQEQEKKLTTYDLEVEKSHNFVANGVVVHNSVYKFRGAAISNILTFKEDYSASTTIVLDENYRSKQEVLDPAYELIQHNNPDTLEARLGITKKLKSRRNPPTGGEVKFSHCDRVENEADWVAQKIRDLNNEEKYDFGDFAILVRANNHADAFIQALRRHNIPYQFLGPGRLFRQDEVIDLISYLRVLYNFEDSLSFLRILTMKHFQIPARDVAALGNYAKKQGISLYEAAENPQNVNLSEVGKKRITDIVDIVKDHLGQLNDEVPGRILYDFLERTGLLTSLVGPAADVNEKRVKNISKFFDKLKTYEVDHPRARFAEVVDWLELSAELGESPLAVDTDWHDTNAVNILTVHSSKGLEFPVVFMVNLVSQRFPTLERSEQIPIPEELIKEELPQGDYHMQEERRLFYVGMTRAQDRLYLTAADFYGEGKREKKISPFVFEALGEDADGGVEENKYQQLSWLNYQNGNQDNSLITDHRSPITVNYLSHSQIDTFLICPLHYKLRYILGIPSRPSPAQSIGSAVHATLQAFYEDMPKNQQAAEKRILTELEKKWKYVGFDGKKHEKLAFEIAKKFLVGYVENSFDPAVNPVLLEEKFAVPLSKEGEKPLMVGGVMDRVDQLASGRIEIIDYKTGGKVPSQREVDKNLQLSIYALAATEIPNPPFNKKPDEVLLSLYYFEEQKKITTKRTKADLERTKNEIFEIRKQIENSDFECSGHYLCQNNCEYALFCGAEH